jgi:hypothetical protein
MAMTNEDSKPNIDLLVKAVEQYWQTGKVVDAKCDRYGGLIEVTPRGEMGRAFSVNCPCGRYKDTMRGL